MIKTERSFGAVGLSLECTAAAVFVAYFVLARIGLIGLSLPLNRLFIHYILMPLFLAALIGAIGLFFDRRRTLSAFTVAAVLPILAIMGVLNGSF